MTHQFVSPKRSKADKRGWSGFFPYYAGFPDSFAANAIEQFKLSSDDTVLDPWNGSGTTSFATARLGVGFVGCDLNPAMLVVARSRLLQETEADSIVPLGEEILRDALLRRHEPLGTDDPLSMFFGSATASFLRAIELSIRSHLVGSKTVSGAGVNFENMSSLAASNYVALFGVCRSLARKFRSSNPTWLRMPGAAEQRVGSASRAIASLFRDQLEQMADALSKRGAIRLDGFRCNLRLADTAEMQLEPKSIDLVVTSPPYCTRIDYTAATRIELCVLAPLLNVSPRELGQKMIGTTQVPIHLPRRSEMWGKTCNRLLDKIQGHTSKASKSYYYKTHLDYFDKMDKSLSNIVRSMKSGASAIFVVQDSFYKDVHNDLPTIFAEMAQNHGLSFNSRQDFYLRQSMSGVNPRANAYNRRPGATESILLFERKPA